MIIETAWATERRQRETREEELELNRVEQEIEQRADHEAETNAPEFIEWIHDYLDVTDLSSLVGYVLSGSLEAGIMARRIQTKYREWRVNAADQDERDEIARGL